MICIWLYVTMEYIHLMGVKCPQREEASNEEVRTVSIFEALTCFNKRRDICTSVQLLQ